MKKKYTIYAIMPVMALLLLGVANGVAAQTTTSGSSLIDRIATHFNLKQAEVQQVFDEWHQERGQFMKGHENFHAEGQNYLQRLVEAGTITQEQADALAAKQQALREEFHAQRDAVKDMTPEERKTLMDEHRARMEELFKELGIELPEKSAEHKLFGGMGMRQWPGAGR